MSFHSRENIEKPTKIHITVHMQPQTSGPRGTKPAVCVELWNELTGDRVGPVRGSRAMVDVVSFVEAPSSALISRDVICRSASAADADMRVIDALNGGRVLPYRDFLWDRCP